MKEVIESVCEVIDEYGADLCDIDVLIRIDKGLGVAMCSKCAFKDTEVNLLACPYRSLFRKEIK